MKFLRPPLSEIHFLHCTVSNSDCSLNRFMDKPLNNSWSKNVLRVRLCLTQKHVACLWLVHLVCWWDIIAWCWYGVGFSPVILILSDRRGLVDFLITLCGNKLRERVQTVNSTTLCNCLCSSSSSSSSSASSCRATLSPLWRQEEDVLENRM